MRKLILQMQMTMDGFVAGPNGELDWMESEPDGKQKKVLDAVTSNMDTILMGRKMAKDFIQHWQDIADHHPEDPEFHYARIFADTPKIVFSRTVQTLPGRNVRVENGNLIDIIQTLKNQDGKDIIVYGGASFAASLLEHDLIDELYLVVQPVSIGEGMRIFHTKKKFQLQGATAGSNGIILNIYKR